MKKIIILLLIFSWGSCIAQNEVELVQRVLLDYIEGTTYSDTLKIKKAFHHNASLYSVADGELKTIPIKEYVSYFRDGKKQDRIGTIIDIDVINNAATAKVKIEVPSRSSVYIDYFLLLKLNEGWKIIQKIYTRKDASESKTPDTQPLLSKSVAVDSIDRIVTTFMEKEQAAGFAYGIAISGEEPTSRYFGYSNLPDKKIIDRESQFAIASVSKIFTATAILKLLEQGKLALNHKINVFFPDYPKGENITIYHLLTHTSGIKAWYHSEMPENTPESFPNCKQPHLYIQRMQPVSDFEPGRYYNYSNTNYVLLGEIVEIVSGKAYQEFLDDIIFKPADLQNTNHVTHISINEKVTGYELEDDRLIEKDIMAPFGAGSLFSTVDELLSFMNAIASGNIITKASFEQMKDYGVINTGSRANTATYFDISESSSLWQEYGYGMGLELAEFNGRFMCFHSGLTDGCQALLAYFPHNKLSIAILINTQARFMQEVEAILKIVSQIE
ncbi:MAG: serine hydrolase [Chitinophagales bacterium]|nr:serine hydrolase [Chitinophagales bacterium]